MSRVSEKKTTAVNEPLAPLERSRPVIPSAAAANHAAQTDSVIMNRRPRPAVPPKAEAKPKPVDDVGDKGRNSASADEPRPAVENVATDASKGALVAARDARATAPVVQAAPAATPETPSTASAEPASSPRKASVVKSVDRDRALAAEALADAEFEALAAAADASANFEPVYGFGDEDFDRPNPPKTDRLAGRVADRRPSAPRSAEPMRSNWSDDETESDHDDRPTTSARPAAGSRTAASARSQTDTSAPHRDGRTASAPEPARQRTVRDQQTAARATPTPSRPVGPAPVDGSPRSAARPAAQMLAQRLRGADQSVREASVSVPAGAGVARAERSAAPPVTPAPIRSDDQWPPYYPAEETPVVQRLTTRKEVRSAPIAQRPVYAQEEEVAPDETPKSQSNAKVPSGLARPLRIAGLVAMVLITGSITFLSTSGTLPALRDLFSSGSNSAAAALEPDVEPTSLPVSQPPSPEPLPAVQQQAASAPPAAVQAPQANSPPSAGAKRMSPELEGLVRQLHESASALLVAGDVAGARTAFRRAAELGDARSAMSFAETYDPNAISRLGLRGTKPDVVTARKWYAFANELGLVEAKVALQRLPAS